MNKEAALNNEIPCCEFLHVHEDLVARVRKAMPEETDLYELAEFFKAFGDSTRIKILYVLFESEMCVCDIAQLLNMSQSAISHHLRLLKQSKLVSFRKEGKSVIYALEDAHIRSIIRQGMEHVQE
ncbi:MAG: winged helix-turn-helix transcriptional regulator [Firmicutes bacterium]|nr:winged helix-turn-helix transcriptional regulator [Bacillota bacterium]